jgi:hypothetical protein
MGQKNRIFRFTRSLAVRLKEAFSGKASFSRTAEETPTFSEFFMRGILSTGQQLWRVLVRRPDFLWLPA